MVITYIEQTSGLALQMLHLLIHLILKQSHKLDTVIIPILQMRKLRPKTRQLVGSLTPESAPNFTLHCFCV